MLLDINNTGDVTLKITVNGSMLIVYTAIINGAAGAIFNSGMQSNSGANTYTQVFNNPTQLVGTILDFTAFIQPVGKSIDWSYQLEITQVDNKNTLHLKKTTQLNNDSLSVIFV